MKIDNNVSTEINERKFSNFFFFFFANLMFSVNLTVAASEEGSEVVV